MRTGGTRVGNRCYIQAGTQISPSSRVARRLCCEDPATCLYREACSHYTEPVPVAARGGELGAPGSCADHRTCSHVRNCRYEDEGVSMGRARERAVCACDVVWVLKGSDARRHPRPPPRRRRPPSDPRQEAASADRASPWFEDLGPKNPGAFSPGPTAWESNPKRQGGMRTRCPTNPSGDLAPTQGGAGALEPRCV